MKSTNQTQMPEIYTDMAAKAVKHLDLIKAHFVIILPDGTTFDSGSDLITLVGPKKGKKTNQERKMPHGSYSKAFGPQIEAMQVGDVVCLAATPEMIAAGVTLGDIQGSVSTIAHAMWGNDAHKTHKNKGSNCVELLRMA